MDKTYQENQLSYEAKDCIKYGSDKKFLIEFKPIWTDLKKVPPSIEATVSLAFIADLVKGDWLPIKEPEQCLIGITSIILLLGESEEFKNYVIRKQ